MRLSADSYTVVDSKTKSTSVVNTEMNAKEIINAHQEFHSFEE